LYHYIRHLKSTHRSLSKVDLKWLKLLVGGFAFINLWVVLILLESRFTEFGLDSMMGAMESKIRFVYMAVLVVHLLKNSQGLGEIQVEHTIAVSPAPEEPH